MNADRLLALYDRVAEAPDAVGRLRRFVLDLAVRGKLVEQDPADEPASELLKRIEAEKARSVKAGNLRRRKLPSRFGEPPFALPANWRWSRIGDVAGDRGQGIPDRPFTYIDVSAIDKKAGVVADPRVLEPDKAPSRARKVARSGDVVYSCVRPYLLNVAIIEGDYDPPPIASTAFEVLNGYGLVLPRYTWIVLRSSFMIACVERSQRGQAYPAINSTDFAVLPFPLPPLAEQHRIVAKVDELMALCDRLDEVRVAREAGRDRLTRASLSRLSAPEPPETTRCTTRDGGSVAADRPVAARPFRSQARFAVDALPALTARADQVEHLRQTILNLAVRGKLVRQDPADESASELLKRMTESLPTPRKVRQRKTAARHGTPERPFEVPCSWKWAAINVVTQVNMGQSPRSEHYNRTGAGMPFFQGKADFGVRHPTPRFWCTKPTKIAEPGDILLSVRAPVGPTNVAAQRCCIGRGLAALRPLPGLSSDFLLLTLRAFRADLAAQGFGTTFEAITKKQLLSYGLPLAPLAEQRRIVAKVDELMALCDRLEAGLGTAEANRGRLLDSLLRDSLTSHETASAQDALGAARAGA